MMFSIGQSYNGFKLTQEKEIKEMKAIGRVFKHEKSGAQLLYIQNDDDNKVFSITFRTPPTDSTGLPHILEHAVLCGSKNFPAKDPFVELAKGSLNTFLNAMTFSDKTMYPIASRNDKDFLNLMHVYLDAVFYPNIYNKPEILMQEGWHYELENIEDEVTYKGVVYNEMKGAFSSPEQVLFRKMQESLFPDTTYRYDSGGDPEVIPNLTQEDFLNFHSKLYHPSNSYIYLYGDGDIMEHLKFINESYLKDFDKIQIDSKINLQTPYEEPKTSIVEYSISANEKEENKTFLSLNFVVGKSTNPELHLAFDILTYLLLETPAAPLKKALLEANLGKDVFGSYDHSIFQPVLSVVVKNANEEDQDKFEQLVFDTLKQLVEKGIDKKLIEAAINIYEFKLREGDYGRYPKGLIYCMKSMESWLYDADPMLHLGYEDVLKKIKTALTTDYFERLIEAHILNNSHRSLLMVKPKKGLAQEKEEEVKQKLAAYKARLTKDEMHQLVENTLILKKYQEAPNDVKDLEKIPLLSLKDIEPKVDKLPLVEKAEQGIPILLHPMFTNEIAYVNLLFDTTTVPQQLIPYASLLSFILGKVSTEKYNYEDLSNEINIYTGGIDFNIEAYSLKNDDGEYFPKLMVRSSALVKQLPKLFEILGELIENTKFSEVKRLKEIISEVKSRLEMNILQDGHIVAARRVTSYFSPIGKYKELCTGIDFYQFIAELEGAFDNKAQEIESNLAKVAKIIFNKENLLVSLTIEEKDYKSFQEPFASLVKHIGEEKLEKQQYQFDYSAKNEGLLTSSKVQYVAKAYNFQKLGHGYTGHLQVLKTIISLNYLWNKVRVLGGAYGAMAGFSRNGNLYFTSYRDPNLDKTLKIYDEAYKYLDEFSADEREMTKYVIGTISKMDAPLTPSMKGQEATAYYISQITEDDLQRERDEVLRIKSEDIKKLSKLIKEVMEQNYFCVLGNEGKIKERKEVFGNLIDVFN
ncbi:insulinase family protein [Clostridium formicaceticum]|uniref:Peptidase M16 n=1 Tax=Clostridium formicaceticum TaxID=1497 RepID=A0AAC9RJR9_9CLOT|nr:insulinase family protein [Clostridium formicaceticum]AOY76399.1 peptidase M16 [Clostridium formicaceticum]ARE86792.1 Peptidase M16C associated [Clostridium formicaceticum]